jgi:hypothetical protein
MENSKISWFEKILILSGTHLPSIRREVREMVRQYDLQNGGKPKKYTAYAVSSNLIKKSAYKTAGFGGLAAAPGTVPWIGVIGTIIISTTVDIALLLREQIELCYAISVAYDVNMDEDELKATTLALLGFSGSAGAAKGITSGVMRTVVDEVANKYLQRGLNKASVEVAEKLVPKLLGRLYRFIPLLGIPLSASINMASTMMVGNQARKYFSTWYDDEEEEKI